MESSQGTGHRTQEIEEGSQAVKYIDYRLFGLRPPDFWETPLSWEEVLVWLRVRDEQ